MVGFRPDKKFESFFDNLSERGEKSRFLNHAVGFTLSFQSLMEKQRELMQQLLEQQQEMVIEIRDLRNDLEKLKSGVRVQEKTGTGDERPGEDETYFADYLSSALCDISL